MYLKHSINKEDKINIDILNRSFNGVLLIDATTYEIVYLNEAVIGMFGYDVEEFLASGISILSKNLPQETLMNQLDQIIEGHEINYISKIEHADQTVLYVDAKYFLVNKESNYICGIFKNITDKVYFAKEQNYKNTRLNRFLSTLHQVSHSPEFQKGDIKSSSNAITKLLSEAIDVDRVSIRLYNDEHTELISLSLYDKKLNEYLEGKYMSRSMYNEFFDYIENQPILTINDIDKDSVARKLIADFFSKDGMIVSMLMTKIVLEGSIYGYIFFQSRNEIEWDRDTILFASQIADYVAILMLNQKLRKEQELLEEKVKLRTEELEVSIQKETQANLAKRRFLSHMSHELRTPLNALIGYLDLVDPSNDYHENEKYIERMKQGAHDLVSIVDDILDFSKIESGKINLLFDYFQLKSSILQVIKLYDNHLRKSEVKYEYMFDLSEDYYETDEKLMKQILHNLLSNAFKFTKSGSITVNVFESSHTDSQKKNVHIEVRDTGIGIQEHDLTRIFNSFEQSLSLYNTHPKGSGLGLAITKDLVQILGGHIEVESVYGIGSTFRVSIPMRHKKYDVNIETESIRGNHHSSDQLHILIVEDNQINLEILKITLEKANHIVEYAMNGFEGLQKIETTRYDLVLMDIHMPLLDGLDATQLIRLSPKNESLKIIALTANAFEFNEINHLKYGFDGFLVKPVKQNILLQTIQSVYKKDIETHQAIVLDFNVLHYFEKYVKMNIHEGLGYTGQNSKLYFNLIEEFIATHKDTLIHAYQMYHDQKYDGYYREIHTLKGLTKLLGLVHVHQTLISLEEAFKDKIEYYKINERFDTLKPMYDCACFCIEYIIKAFKERGIPYGL